MKRRILTQEVALATPTPRREPLLSPHETTISQPGVPGAWEIQRAIDVLVAAQVADTSIAQGGEEGDIFLCYDITIGTKGRKPFRIRDRRTLHAALTKQGVPSAAQAVELALTQLTQPLSGAAMVWINDMTNKLNPPKESRSTTIFGQ